MCRSNDAHTVAERFSAALADTASRAGLGGDGKPQEWGRIWKALVRIHWRVVLRVRLRFLIRSYLSPVDVVFLRRHFWHSWNQVD